MAHSSNWLEDFQGNVNEDAGRTDPRDWLDERGYRCPECGGMGSKTRANRLECESCGHESYTIERDERV